ncbi:MAG TPA: group 1 glycosyl transferase, partial [Methylotenera sp.]|nr:group 1 glycosyl transferase [Methylotenera sp.]
MTCFDQNQPGYLDFSYRIASLAKDYQLTIISLAKITQAELMFEKTQYHVIPTSDGKLDWMTYLVKSAWFIRQEKPDVVMLLHSAVAPISLLIGGIPSCVYWNEHPFNLIRLPEKSSPIRYYASVFSQKLIFHGAKKAHVVMPIGEEQRDDLIARGCDLKRVQMIYMGAADNFLVRSSSEYISEDEPLRLIYIGTVSKERG